MRRAVSRLVTANEVTAPTRFGSRFRLRLDDYIDNIVLNEGYYETEVLRAMHEGVPNGACVWDVGANFGLHCVTLKLLRPDLRIIAFEPAPEQAARIIENAALNGVSLDILTMGLGAYSSIGRLYIMRKGNPGMTTFSPWSKVSYDMHLQAQIETGDRLIELEIVPYPYLLKVDVEGAEEEVFKGLNKTLSGDRVRRVIFEGGPELCTLVASRSFVVRELRREENTGHVLHNYVGDR
jgi:FkbM family methyltransferase